jgi:plastocyanin
MRLVLLLLLASALAAGGGGGGDDGGDDDSAPIDAAAAAVTEVSCSSATVALTITTAGGEYAPQTATISAGDVVDFTLTAGHTAHSIDDLFAVGQGERKCLRFDVAGTYGFYCQVHGFTGSLTVE